MSTRQDAPGRPRSIPHDRDVAAERRRLLHELRAALRAALAPSARTPLTVPDDALPRRSA